MNNTIEEIHSKIPEGDAWGGNHCHKTEKKKKKRMKRNEDSLRDLWNNIKCTDICIIEVPEEEERKHLRKYLKRL